MSKDTKKILTPVDRSTKQLESAEANLSKVLESMKKDVGDLTKQAIETATNIEFKQSELSALEDEYANKEREAKAELSLRIKENEIAVLEALLKTNGLVKLTNAEHTEMKKTLTALQESFDEEVNLAKTKSFSEAKQHFDSSLSSIESQHKVEIAELKAKAGADQFKIEQLEDMVKNLRENLEAERETRVKIAQADAGKQGVIVNTSK